MRHRDLGFALLLLAAPAPAQISYRLVALSGDPAPAAGSGAVFAQFGNVPLLGNDFPPRLDAEGRVTFHTLLEGPGIVLSGPNGGNALALYVEEPGGLRLVARQGELAPGTQQQFLGFPSGLSPVNPDIADGVPAFGGGLVTSIFGLPFETGIWDDQTLIARYGDPVPGSSRTFDTMAFPVVREQRALAFNAQVSSPTFPRPEGLFAHRGGVLSTLVLDGQQAPGFAPGVVFGTWTVLQSGGAIAHWGADGLGRVCFAANLGGAVADLRRDEAIYVETAGGLELFLKEGDPIPGRPGASFGNPFGLDSFQELMPLRPNRHGDLLFGCEVGGPSLAYHQAIFTNRDGGLEQVSPSGEPVPGLPGQVFGVPVMAHLNDADRLSFLSSYGPFLSSATQPAIFTDRSGTLELLVQAGDPLPDDPLARFTGFAFGFGGFPVASNLGHVVFLGETGGGHFGFFLALPAGELHTIVRTGVPFDVRGDGTDLRLPIGILASPQLGRNGELALEITFADGSSGLFVAAPQSPIRDLHTGLSGSRSAPVLSAYGTLAPASPLAIRAAGAPPGALAALVAGTTAAHLPFRGGTLVPAPERVLRDLLADAAGRVDLAATWPATLPSGARVYLQAVAADAGAPFGSVLSNALELTAP